MSHHLAQVNVARMRADPGSPEMSGLVTRIDEMNRLAEQSRGFVWRWKGAEAGPDALRVLENYLGPFEPDRLFYNLSVWESVEDLRRYTFQTAHAGMLRDKHEWIEPFDLAQLALWWIPIGHVPTIAESGERLRTLHTRGPTPEAFTFRERFAGPGASPGV